METPKQNPEIHIPSPQQTAKEANKAEPETKTPPTPKKDHALSKDFVFRWRGPEYIKFHKSYLWYVIAVSLTVIFLWWAIWDGSLTLLTTVILLVGLYYYQDKKNPREVEITIAQSGFQIDKSFHPYNHFSSFRLEHHPHFNYLYFRESEHMQNEIGLLLPPNLKPHIIREFLSTKLPEQDKDDSRLIDILLRLLKF